MNNRPSRFQRRFFALLAVCIMISGLAMGLGVVAHYHRNTAMRS